MSQEYARQAQPTAAFRCGGMPEYLNASGRTGCLPVNSWMNRYRRVLARGEKKVENYEAMLHFSCGVIVWNKILLG